MIVCDLVNASSPVNNGGDIYLAQRRKFVEAQEGRIRLLQILPADADGEVRGRHVRQVFLRGRPAPTDPCFQYLTQIRRAAAILRAERPDVIETVGPHYVSWVARAARPRTPLVGSYLVDLPAYFESVAPARWRPWVRRLRPLVWAGTKLLYRPCDAVVAISPALGKRLRRGGMRRVATIPWGVDADLFHPDRRDAAQRAAWDAGPDKTVLLYVGRFAPEKELPVLFEAFRRLAAGGGYRLVLLGDGEGRAAVEALAATAPGVTYAGYLGHGEALARAYASADVFVTPGGNETLGLTAIEALASGVPVVGVRRGAIQSVVTDEVGALAPPGDPAGFAAAVEAVRARGPATLGAAARRRAVNCFSWAATFDRTFTLYQRLLAARRQAPAPHGAPVPDRFHS